MSHASNSCCSLVSTKKDSASYVLFYSILENKYLRMERCGDFVEMRLDQRLEVRNDEIASVCSKFAQGS